MKWLNIRLRGFEPPDPSLSPAEQNQKRLSERSADLIVFGFLWLMPLVVLSGIVATNSILGLLIFLVFLVPAAGMMMWGIHLHYRYNRTLSRDELRAQYKERIRSPWY